MLSSHFEPKCKIAWKSTELGGPLSCEVIDLDSKPVKVSLDFDEKYLPFYCNLLTRPDFPLCALAWVLKSHKIDWDRYLSRGEKGGKSFFLPSPCNVTGNHTVASLKTDKPEHDFWFERVPVSVLYLERWNFPCCSRHGFSGHESENHLVHMCRKRFREKEYKLNSIYNVSIYM